MNKQIPQRLGILVAYLLFMITYIPVGLAANELEIEGARKLVEQIETGEVYSFSPEQLTHEIDQAKQALDARLELRQDDIEALILSVRLSIFEEVAIPSVLSKGNPPPESKSLFSSQHSSLDRVLKLQPDNAEVNYWKARLYGIQPPTIGEGGRLLKRPIDLDKAIYFARKAVQLDPKNVGYREALALYLVDGQYRKEALEVMSATVTEDNPVNILLNDLDAFPLPEGTTFLKEDSQSFGVMQMLRRRITNLPQLRVRVFIVPMGSSAIEAFYRRQWPKFKLLSQDSAGPFAQYLKFEVSGVSPAASMSELAKWVGKTDGILLTMSEVRNATEAQREESPAGHRLPPALGEVFSYMFYVNYRRID